MTPRYHIAIDPGASGAIAYIDLNDGIVKAVNMPDGTTAICDELRAVSIVCDNGLCIMEKVGTYVKGNAVGSACKFARHCGALEAALYMAGIPFTEVAPQVWMKKLGTLPTDKAERKRAIREWSQRRFPHLTVTLANADALALLAAMNEG